MPHREKAQRYLAEFVIIFLGVSLSFVAENYREERAARANERLSLERMLEDLTETDFDREVRTYEQATSASRLILDARRSPVVPRDTLTGWINRATRCVPSVVNTSEYESLKGSGGLNRISDASLRQSVATHYERYPAVYRLVEMDCDWSFLDPVSAEVEADWTDAGPGMPQFAVTGSAEGVIGNRDFMLALAQVHYRKNILRQRFGILADERAALIERVQQSLTAWD